MDVGIVAVATAWIGGLIAVITVVWSKRTTRPHRIDLDGHQIAEVPADAVSTTELRDALQRFVTAAARDGFGRADAGAGAPHSDRNA